MFTDSLWRFLILETFMMGAVCIYCVYDHPQKKYCTNEFVVKVRFPEENNVTDPTIFPFDILKLYKGDIVELLRQKRSTPRDIVVRPGGTYVIFADTKNGTRYNEMCFGEWRLSKGFYERAFTTYYKRNCNCYNSTGNYTSEKRCEWEYSFMKRRDGICNWVNTSNYQRCQQELIQL